MQLSKCCHVAPFLKSIQWHKTNEPIFVHEHSTHLPANIHLSSAPHIYPLLLPSLKHIWLLFESLKSQSILIFSSGINHRFASPASCKSFFVCNSLFHALVVFEYTLNIRISYNIAVLRHVIHAYVQ